MGLTIADSEEAREALRKAFGRASSAVFFGGAGVSTASGIPDFRSEDGLYRQHFAYPPEEMLSHGFFESHPEEFFDFYRKKMICLGAKPNACHRKLAELEASGRLRAVVTQNIDGLHQAAGSRAVFELHGSVHRNTCLGCGATYSAEWVLGTTGVPRCPRCGGVVKPDVVLYGEPLDEDVWSGALAAISAADLLVVGGTSLAVYPAANLLRAFSGGELVVCNRDPTPVDAEADLVISCDIAEAFGF